jgi:methylase of polypeptide subunit release factors
MFEPFRGERFDLVVCNPPYLKGEPTSPGTLAYMAGDDFRWLRRFARQAAGHLAPGGRCLLVLADSTDLSTILDIFRRGGWAVRFLARRDLVVERLFIVELIVQSNVS